MSSTFALKAYQDAIADPYCLGSTASYVDPVGRVPDHFGLGILYPNPFNGLVSVPIVLNGKGEYRVDIYALLGEHVRQLAVGQAPGGTTLVQRDATDDGGRAVASGIYIVVLRSTAGRSLQRCGYLK